MILDRKKLILPLLILAGLMGLFRCQGPNELSSGKEIYRKYCVNCHGIDGTLSHSGALDLSQSRLPLDGRKEIIRKGRVTMMGFEEVLSDAQIDSVANYTLKLIKE